MDPDDGRMLTKRWRIATPQPATPEAVAAAVGSVARQFDDVSGPIGITFPAVVENGVTLTAANVDDAWIGTDAVALFSEQCGRPVSVVNDADAAGIAEMAFGAGVGRDGVVIVLTFGTGIGSGMFLDGSLVPNTEFGLLELHGAPIEQYCAGRIKDEAGLTYNEWGDRVNELLTHVDRLFLPELLVIGGGISKYFDEFVGRFDVRPDVLPAGMRNDAGIIGAAMVAASIV